MGKKAQMYGAVLRAVIAVVILVLVFYFGFKGLNRILERRCESEFILLQKDLEGASELISTQIGSIEEEKYTVPCKTERVYFIDLEQEIDKDIANESVEINESYTAGAKKNVFFMKGNRVVYSMYLPELKLKYPYYRCFDTRRRAKMGLYLEGYKDGTNVINKEDSVNCGYIPVLMENETQIEGVLNAGDVIPEEQGQAIFAIKKGLSDDEIKEKIKKTEGNVFIGRKVDIKKDGTEIKIRIVPKKGKKASGFTYVESIPKECIGDLENYLNIDDLEEEYPDVYINPDPIIVWDFGGEQITEENKKEIEYELDEALDCIKLINALGFGEIS